MLIVRFGGGLGNQLFQYALLLTLKNEFLNENIKCDITAYDFFNEHSGFEISRFFEFDEELIDLSTLKNIKPIEYILIKNTVKINSLKMYNVIYKIEKVIQYLYTPKYKKENIEIINDKIFAQGSYSKDNICYFDGSWQNISMYDIALLREHIRFKIKLNLYEKNVLEKILRTNSIAVHVRRGDYVRNKKYNLCTANYYKKAIDTILEKNNLTLNDVVIYFFSDDHNYIKNEFDYPNMLIVSGQSSGSELYLMSNAKYNIIANSTFSFWGAILNKNSKMVIAPQYFVKVNRKYYSFNTPEEWLTINNII